MKARKPKPLRRAINAVLTSAQKRLKKKHGTPSEFAVAVYQCVPGEISMTEAAQAVHKYCQEWGDAAKRQTKHSHRLPGDGYQPVTAPQSHAISFCTHGSALTSESSK